MPSDAIDEHGLPVWGAPERNKQPIAEVLERVLPERGLLLEIASGSGQHAAYFVSALPGWTIQPSDCDPENLDVLRRRVAVTNHPRLLAPLELDVTREPPPLEPTAIFCANMVHIAPWVATLGLFGVGERLLRAGAPLV